MDRYVKMEELGEGSFGVVWKALDRKTGEVVAIKRLHQPYYSKDECMNLIEVKSLLKMKNHPNIVKLKQIVREHTIVYMVFEYMECNLYELTAGRKKSFSETEIKHICFQLFEGLAYMHYKGYIHRDIKPENILVNEDVIKIGDLGRARELDGRVPYTDSVANCWYRAPEVFLGAEVYDFAIDMWAVGAIMVELFNLEPLFEGDNGAVVMDKICRVLGTPTKSTWSSGIDLTSENGYQFPEFDGVKLSELLPTASSEAVDLVGELLTWDPCKRPTALEVLQHPFFDSCYP
ncbi:cyclin-dependent kinase F-4-like [Rutidosis leptorrhynchoides]|uniref:cyclin-dependent kinase F-4-like n=1 Tax=Rutidosis leptorrhynchoides TaxID=125765 RepID=UPI003A98F817